jgi:hypothetical protein
MGPAGGGTTPSLSALEPQHAPIVAVGQRIEPAVGALAHVADAFVQARQQAFPSSDSRTSAEPRSAPANRLPCQPG